MRAQKVKKKKILITLKYKTLSSCLKFEWVELHVSKKEKEETKAKVSQSMMTIEFVLVRCL